MEDVDLENPNIRGRNSIRDAELLAFACRPFSFSSRLGVSFKANVQDPRVSESWDVAIGAGRKGTVRGRNSGDTDNLSDVYREFAATAEDRTLESVCARCQTLSSGEIV